MNKERRAALKRIQDQLDRVYDEIDEVIEAEEESLGNLPESLSQSLRYQRMEDAIHFLNIAEDLVLKAQAEIDNAISC